MKHIYCLLFLLIFSAFSKEKPLLSFGMGVFDIKHGKYRTMEYRLEYRPAKVFYTIRPTIGLMVTAKSSLYFYGGFGFEWFYKYLFFSPNFAVGIYKKNQGKDLGFPIEFRSGIETGIKFNNCMRLGIHFYHVSNARKLFHWSKKNPGEESLVIFYSFPI
jgi:lipid A 3-O-deacylase